MQELNKIKETAIEAAREAGKYALERIGNLGKIEHKEGISNLVTDVDRRCERIIIDRIKKEFPSHSILAEESGEKTEDETFRWIIDPLDGTTNYSHGLPVFCISIGVLSGGSVKVGVVYVPTMNELFVAEEGKGAFLNGEAIKVSKQESVQDSLIATGFAYSAAGKRENLEYFQKMLESAQAVRRLGSAAIDLCYVACGRFDGFWELGLNPWDTAAGQLIVTEAGGKVTLLDGKPFDIYQKTVVATNSKIHKELLTLLNK